MTPVLVVAAAVISRNGRYFLTRRPAGAHLAGAWEFPGGKCEPGESLESCLARELLEELGARAAIGAEIFSTVHDYADRRVRLHFFCCELMDEPAPRLGQEMRWVTRSELRDLEFPPADAELIELLAKGHEG